MATSRSKRRKVESENRSFNESWTTDYLFVEHNGKPQCLVCGTSVSVFKEYNIKRHYDTNHSDTYKDIAPEIRNMKITELKKKLRQQKTLSFFASSSNAAAVSASYEVAHMIAKHCKPFQDGEFVKECVLECARSVCPNQEHKFKEISLSRKTITSRITEMSSDSRSQLTTSAQSFCNYSIALDESTDASDTAQLLVFVRGVTDDFVVSEELVQLCSMKSNTTGKDIAKETIAAIDKLQLPWDKLAGITTDGAPAMTGKREGAATIIAKHAADVSNNDNVMKYHCIIHQEALSAKTLGFNDVMKAVIADVNFIRAKALKHRQFKNLLEETDAQYSDICYYTEVRWLSKGRVLERVFSLRTEMKDFLQQNGRETGLSDPQFVCDVAFLADITKHLNTLNQNLQGKDKQIVDLFSHVKAFKAKLGLFIRQFSVQNFAHFPNLNEVKDQVDDFNCQAYVEALTRLVGDFNARFEDFGAHEADMRIMGNPFEAVVDNSPERLQMELIDLQSSADYKSLYTRSGNLSEFYRQISGDSFPELRKHASKFLSLFGSSYICEQTFSLMNLTKSKLRTRLTDDNLEAVLRLATTNLAPNIEKLVANRPQCQTSH